MNRVAAGEVIHRPPPLKELLENALDAGATSITVTVKDGGNKLSRSRTTATASARRTSRSRERHTTSKLELQDLDTVRTFGFRGEAPRASASSATLR